MPNIPYNRAAGRRLYVSIPKHQRNAHNSHSKWLSVPIEQSTFDAADYGNQNRAGGNDSWEDDNGNLWGFLADFDFVGTENQQFGFFDNPNNPVLAWHGFPVVPFSAPRYRISQALLERWILENYIDEDDIEDIIKGKRIK